MRTFSTALQNALNDPERYGFVLLTFTLGSNVYGIWTGQGEVTYNGIVYRGGGSLIDADDVQDNGDGSIGEMTLSLSESPDKGISVDVLSSFFSEDWHMQSVVLELGMLDPDTGLPIDSFVLFDGVIAQAPLRKGTGKFRLELRLISRAYKLSEAGGKYRNVQTQALVDDTDTSLVDIGIYGTTRQKELKWGQGST